MFEAMELFALALVVQTVEAQEQFSARSLRIHASRLLRREFLQRVLSELHVFAVSYSLDCVETHLHLVLVRCFHYTRSWNQTLCPQTLLEVRISLEFCLVEMLSICRNYGQLQEIAVIVHQTQLSLELEHFRECPRICFVERGTPLPRPRPQTMTQTTVPGLLLRLLPLSLFETKYL